MTTVVIHQPEYFPWLGFLDKARRADVLVLLDHVQFDRSSLQHRARLAGAAGLQWLTIPFVHKFPQRIDEVRFADERWRVRHEKTVQTFYGRAPGFAAAAPALAAFFATPHDKLVDATIASVELLLDAFAVRPPRVVRSSTLGVTGEKAEVVLDVCRRLAATRYVSGRSGATYLDRDVLAAAGVELVVQSYTPASYPRPRPLPEEAPGLSALDAWLCVGQDAPQLMRSP